MQVYSLSSLVISSVEARLCSSLSCVRRNANEKPKRLFLGPIGRITSIHSSSRFDLFVIRNNGYLPKLRNFSVKLKKVVGCYVSFRDCLPILLFRVIVGVMLFVAVSVPVAKSPSCKFYCLIVLLDKVMIYA